MNDPYNPPPLSRPLPDGCKNVLGITNGRVVMGAVYEGERPNFTQKSVRELEDVHIGQMCTFKNGRIDYWVGKAEVSWRPTSDGRGNYACKFCRKRECAHTRRLDKFRTENFL